MNIYWMEYSPLEGNVSATDPLALDYLAQQLGYLPLPNFTGRTSRARYYSMVCYGLYICEEIIKRDNLFFNDETVLSIFEAYEKYWAYAVVTSYNGELRERDGIESGFRGKRGAIKAYNNKIKKLGSEYRLLSRQLELGALGAYRSSLERFGLINQLSLSLTMAGREISDSFLKVSSKIRMQYDELIIESIRNESIIEKKGSASIRMFGEYGGLDYYKKSDNETIERTALRKYVIEADSITFATVRMAFSERAVLEKNILKGISSLADFNTKQPDEIYVRDFFKTIHSFELLSKELNNIFCSVLMSSFENGGTATIRSLSDVISPYYDNIFSNQLAQNLADSPKYYELLNTYYGNEFANLISKIILGLSREQLIKVVLDLHREVEAKRQSLEWISIEGDLLMAYSGYEYSKSNLDRSHNYKIPNLFSIIYDAGWRPL